MILYLDTSSLVKLYTEEAGSEAVRQWVEEAQVVATSRVAYVEARAAFARKSREGSVPSEIYAQMVADLDSDWENFFIVEVSQNVVRVGSGLAERHALRGFDALHLASALVLRKRTKLPVAFSCFDDVLLQAAEAEGLRVQRLTS
ncbi:MAG: type II toxin-antitoxin system VapC family toxin [Candidatus Bipolaricaulota bacterium]|nr:type II toxin-antitoxin system VapC family toxin [Candidatus Bipolaricaulota bacterium]